jgi:hypothetical protein
MDAQYGQFFDQVSFTRLIFVSAAFTALCWLLVLLLKLAEIERGQRAGQLKESGLIIDSAENPPLHPSIDSESFLSFREPAQMQRQ